MVSELVWHCWKWPCLSRDEACLSCLLGSCTVSRSLFLPLHWCRLDVSSLSFAVPCLKGSVFSGKAWRVEYLKMAWVSCSTEGWPCSAFCALASAPMVHFQPCPGEEPGFAPLLLMGCYVRHVASSAASSYIWMFFCSLIQLSFSSPFTEGNLWQYGVQKSWTPLSHLHKSQDQ